MVQNTSNTISPAHIASSLRAMGNSQVPYCPNSSILEKICLIDLDPEAHAHNQALRIGAGTHWSVLRVILSKSCDPGWGTAVKSTVGQRHQSAERNPELKKQKVRSHGPLPYDWELHYHCWFQWGWWHTPKRNMPTCQAWKSFSVSSKKDMMTSTGAREGLDLSGTHRPWDTWL